MPVNMSIALLVFQCVASNNLAAVASFGRNHLGYFIFQIIKYVAVGVQQTPIRKSRYSKLFIVHTLTKLEYY